MSGAASNRALETKVHVLPQPFSTRSLKILTLYGYFNPSVYLPAKINVKEGMESYSL